MKRSKGFTLIEILIVLAIIGILAALLFPVFKSVRERANQASCTSNLQQIGLAVALYRQDEKEFPSGLVVLLSDNAKILKDTTTTDINGVAGTCPDEFCTNIGGTGYLKSDKVLVCADDDDDTAGHSSYGDLSTKIPAAYTETSPGRFVWNYFGYKSDGSAYPTMATLFDGGGDDVIADELVNPLKAWDLRTNPVKYSLSNRFAPASTIVTRCVYHRTQTSDQATPSAVTKVAGARDILLFVDGSARLEDISTARYADWKKASLP